MSKLPDEASDLFGVDPDKFVAHRDALAKELEGEGSSEAAKAVKQLRKPTLATWATNQSARRRPDLVERLLAAGRTMLAAASSAELREASTERQSLVGQLLNEASAALREGGHPAAATVTDKITRTLLAVASGDAQETFARGMLTKELEPELGFGFVPPPPGVGEGEEGASGAVDETRTKAEQAERKVHDLEAELAEMEREARAAEDRVQLAQMEAERAAKKAETARSRLSKAQKEAADLREAVKKLK